MIHFYVTHRKRTENKKKKNEREILRLLDHEYRMQHDILMGLHIKFIRTLAKKRSKRLPNSTKQKVRAHTHTNKHFEQIRNVAEK